MKARDTDMSKAGIARRAKHAEHVLKAEVRILADEVGADMAVCGLVGVAHDFALEAGISRDRFAALLVDLLYRVVVEDGKLKR